ncbi:MAG: LPS export ABC transporter permease LptG [Thiohalobacteraceae bacterium]
MRILDRYLGKTVIGGMLLALLILLAVDLFFTFINEVQDIGKGNYGLASAFAYVGLTVPGRIHQLFPMAALLGSLMSLGVLASNSELVSMRAAGVSILRIARSVLQAGLILLLVAAAAGEWLAPWTQQLAEQRRALAQSETITFRSQYGFWARDGQQFINIGQILPDGRLADVQVYDLATDGRLEAAMHAAFAEHIPTGWRLYEVQRGELGEVGFRITKAEQLVWPSLLSPELLSVVTIAPEDLSARDLYRYARYMRSNGLDAGRYELAFWQRVFAPLAGLVMLFLSIPFVFGPLRSVSAGQRLLWGIMTGVAFFLLNRTMSHMGQIYGFPPLLSALAPSLLFLGGGLWVMRSVR